MKKKSIWLSIIMITILRLLTGCSVNTQSVDLAICGSFGVPGMLCADLKGGAYECVILEEDTQGRILYEYITQSVITGKEERAVVICQKRDADAVYYYEDVCYLLTEWTDDDILLLKAWNDWDCPLDNSKMTRKSNKTTLDGFVTTYGDLEYKQVEQACCDELSIEQQQILELSFLDADSSKMELYWLVVNGDLGEECYFALVDTDYHIACQRVERSMDALTELVTFKDRTGDGLREPF